MQSWTPPWDELAIAVERAGNSDDGQVLCEGKLRMVANTVAQLPVRNRNHVRVSLPDRRAAPFSYAGPTLEALLALLPTRAL